jgi:hypothetical protein
VSCPCLPPHPPFLISFRSALSPLSRGESNRQAAQWRQACSTTRKRTCVFGQQAQASTHFSQFLIYNIKRVSGLAWHTTTFVFLDFPLAWNVDQPAYPASTSRARIAGASAASMSAIRRSSSDASRHVRIAARIVASLLASATAASPRQPCLYSPPSRDRCGCAQPGPLIERRPRDKDAHQGQPASAHSSSGRR